MKKSKLQPLLRTTLLLLALLTNVISAFAHDFEVDGIYYNIIDNEAVVTFRGSSYNEYTNEYSGTVVIPSSVTNPDNGLTYPVTAIGSVAFSYCDELNSVIIGNSVTTIGDYAFYYCAGLTTVTIPKSVTYIGNRAFRSCTALNNVTIPKSVTTIGYGAFLDCNALDIVYSQIVDPSVMSMSYAVFEARINYDDRTLYVPEGSVEAYQDDEKWSDYFGSIYEKEYHDVDFEVDGIYYMFNNDGDNTVSVTYKGDDYYDYYNYLDRYSGHVEIPAVVSYNGITYTVTSIGQYAFFLCEDLTSVTSPNTVTSIERCAFSDCKGLSNVSIGNSVTTIGEEAFQSCYNLKSIEIPNSVTVIGPEAIAYCRNLERVIIGISLTEIGSDAFYGNYALTLVKVLAATPPSLLNDRTFYGCYNTATLEVPVESVEAYRTHQYWGLFQTIRPIEHNSGDMNADGVVNIADMNVVINVILKGSNDNKCDVNGDGTVNISDINAIIAAILGN